MKSNYSLKQKNILARLGENIKLARLRRKLSTRSHAGGGVEDDARW